MAYSGSKVPLNYFDESTNLDASFSSIRTTGSVTSDLADTSSQNASSNSLSWDSTDATQRSIRVCDTYFSYRVWGMDGNFEPMAGTHSMLGFKIFLEGEEPDALRVAQPGASLLLGDSKKSVTIGNEDYGCFKTRDTFESLAKLALFAAASSGVDNCVIPLEHIPRFVQVHNERIFVCQHASLDFHLTKAIIAKGLPETEDALDWWNDAVTECKLRDIFVLDTLIRLALEDGSTKPRPLGEIIAQYAKFDIDNQDQSHFRYGQRFYQEPISSKYTADGEKRPIWDDRIVAYGVRDAIVLQAAYVEMAHEAKFIMDVHKKEIFSNATDNYGPLSEGIQVKGNIVLSAVTMNGIAIDMDLAEKVRGKMEKRLEESIRKIQSNEKWKGLFHLTVGPGGLVPERESGKPRISKARLEELLIQACAEITEKYQIEITLPIDAKSTQPLSPYMKEQQKLQEAKEKARGEQLVVPQTGPKLSLSTKTWAEFAQYHEFIAAWIEMEQAAHFNAFLSHLKREDNPNVLVRAHPEYCVMVRNGRSAAQNPPIQQTPRKGGFREIFRASPGHVLVTVDYDFIELCTLAAVCLARYGHSTLANVIKHGVDPHAFTASMIEGVSLEEFLTWKNHQDEGLRKKFANLRQRAKAVNFGIPSGLTAAGLGHYAKSAYGVELSTEDAEKFRTTLVEKIYPELSLYLQENDMSRLASNLKIPEEICWNSFSFGKKNVKDGDFEAATRSPAIEGGIRNIVRGRKTRKRDGKEYSPFFVKKIWNALLTLARDPDMYNSLKAAKGEGSEEIFRMLFGRPVATLTGRIRGKVGFTQACNTPFSGLAADGAKLAMWNLYLLGYNIIGFIHDEIIVEIPETSSGTYTAEVKEIQNIICQSMQELTGPIPISCSASVSYVWSKNAKAMYNEAGDIIPWTMTYDPTLED